MEEQNIHCTMINNIKNITIFALILIIFIMNTCGNDYKINRNNDIVNVIEIIDTNVITKEYIDTIPFYDTTKIFVDITIPTNPIKEDSLNVYNIPYSDSLIEINNTIKVDGTLIDMEFNYIPKFPKYIIKTDTIFSNITKTIINNKVSRTLLGGIEVGGNKNTFDISAIASYKDKKNNIFTFRYGMFNKTFNLSFQKPIKF